MKKKLTVILIVLLSVMLLFAISVSIVLTQFRLDTIQVTGNTHYTNEEIVQLIKDNEFIDNTLLLYWRHKVDPIKDVPFIEKLDIEYISKHVLTITVYEKSIAGCMQYMNRYVYFDKDGIVLDTSVEKLDDIPCISGMKFNSVVVYERLPIEDSDRFSLILNMTQLIAKYSLKIDDIRFTNNDEIILYCGDVKVLLGDGSNIEEKMVDLGNILESLGDKKGTLDMKDFMRDKENASFKADNKE